MAVAHRLGRVLRHDVLVGDVHSPDEAAVCVLIDGIGSGYFFPAMYRRLRGLGIPAGLFM
jgi:hypothetical protein